MDQAAVNGWNEGSFPICQSLFFRFTQIEYPPSGKSPTGAGSLPGHDNYHCCD